MGATPEKKKGGCGKIILIVVLIFVLLSIVGGLISAIRCFVCSGGGSSEGGAVTVGTPISGTFGTGLPTDEMGKPYLDYTLNVATAGTYIITLTSVDTTVYDPYISLMQAGAQVAYNDDGDNGLNSRLEHEMQPGDYVIRVTRFGGGQLESAVDFTLTVTQSGAAPVGGTPPAGGQQPAAGGVTPPAGGATPPAGGVPPPAGGGGGGACDRLETCCATAAVTAVPAFQGSCGQIQTFRGLPGGAGETSCQTSLQRIQGYFASPATPSVPAECQ